MKNTKQFKKGQTPWNKGKKFTEESRKKMSMSKINAGIVPPSRKGIKLTEEHKAKIVRKKEKHWNWKGGLTELNERIRKSVEYKLWRKAVFERDDYACIWCGKKNGRGKAVTLHADHIKPFALFTELRFAIDNGRTLCIDCHKTTDTYGRGTIYRNKLLN